MLDHVFTDAIGALRDAFESAFLERQAFDEHFQVDVLMGDMSWETSYGPPGRGSATAGRRPHHVRLADVEPDLVPALVRRRGPRSAPGDRDGDRVPRPAAGAAAGAVRGAERHAETSPLIGNGRLERAGTTIEITHADARSQCRSTRSR
jgi:hypothetical protein